MFSGGHRDVVEERRTRLPLVAIVVVLRDEPLVAPPEVHLRPVDAVACGRAVDRLEHRDAHRPAGQSDVRFAEVVEDVDGLGEEACGDRPGERLLVGVDEHPAFVGHRFRARSRIVDGLEQLEALGDDLTVEVVGVEPTQFLGEAVAEAPAWQREVVGRLVRLGQRAMLGISRSSSITPDARSRLHAVDAARAVRTGRQLVLDRDLELQREPGGEQQRRGGVGRAGDLDRGDRLVRRLVEHRGELRPPERQARPGEVGVAGRVGVRQVAQRLLRVGLRGRVGDPPRARCGRAVTSRRPRG